MSVTVAKTAGFCFGVRRAVDLAEQQTRQGGEIYAYGEIILLTRTETGVSALSA